jgi:D-alanyl-D-alanine carboxypeptidase/D-alanyl-D-alanine-endopeptidase (penicillin-binding protein 4)
VALAVAALVGGGGAVLLEAGVPVGAEPVGGGRVQTPVLSARRAPTVVAAPIADRRLRTDLEQWASAAGPDSCAVVVEPDGDVVLDHRADAAVIPASTTKLLTATGALEALGADARFRTTAVAAAPAVGGVIAGDLTLVGGGDPLLATADYLDHFERQPQIATSFEGLAQQLVAAGVRQITGSVVGDESRLDQQRYVAAWPSRYIDQDQVGPLSALQLNDGFSEYPTAPGVFEDLVQAPDPPAQAAAVLTFLLEANGIDVVGAPRTGVAPAGAVEVAAAESPPMTEVVTELLRESDNMTAELLVKELGRVAGDPTTAGGVAALAATLSRAGLDVSRAAFVDGSGLAVEDRVTCSLLVDALRRPDTGPVLLEALPVAGESGTLVERFVGTALAGHLRAKTGSLNAVASLAGVVEDADGAVTFAYVANAPGGRIDEAAVVAAQQQLGEILLAWPRVPDASVLGPLPALLEG